MRHRLLPALFVASTVGALPASATPVSFLSARTVPDGRSAVAGSLGFPYLGVMALRGVGEAFDVGVIARSAWQNAGRVGVVARARVADRESLSFGLRATTTVRIADASPDWERVTGDAHVSAAVDLIASWRSPRGAVLSLAAGGLVIGHRSPPALPLEGPPGWLTLGTNVAGRVGVELPLRSGLVVALELGADIHLSGFDGGWVLPVFSLGGGGLL